MSTSSLVILGRLAVIGCAGDSQSGLPISYLHLFNVAVIVLVILLVAFIIYLQRQRKIILRKNSMLAKKVQQTAHLVDIIKHEETIYTSDMPPVETDNINKQNTEMIEKSNTGASDESTVIKPQTKEELKHESQLKVLVGNTIRREKLYLREHLTFKDLSAATGISQMKLRALFGENQTYMTLNECINRRFRIPQVLQMLREHPEYTVEAIARECGYQNMKTFFNWFHRELGMTPREYCKTLEQPDNTTEEKDCD